MPVQKHQAPSDWQGRGSGKARRKSSLPTRAHKRMGRGRYPSLGSRPCATGSFISVAFRARRTRSSTSCYFFDVSRPGCAILPSYHAVILSYHAVPCLGQGSFFTKNGSQDAPNGVNLSRDIFVRRAAFGTPGDLRTSVQPGGGQSDLLQNGELPSEQDAADAGDKPLRRRSGPLRHLSEPLRRLRGSAVGRRTGMSHFPGASCTDVILVHDCIGMRQSTAIDCRIDTAVRAGTQRSECAERA